jgi:hypothetical protein
MFLQCLPHYNYYYYYYYVQILMSVPNKISKTSFSIDNFVVLIKHPVLNHINCSPTQYPVF